MAIGVIGIDFQLAPVEVREQLALSGPQVLELLRIIAREDIFREAMILSTCNRTEFYYARRPGLPDPLPHLCGHIAQVRGAMPISDPTVFFRHEGPPAVEHLFRVAASLESQVLGEHEIMGQLKEAYRLACEARTAKFLFHKLMHWAFRAGKRVLSQTALGQGTASVSQAAVDLSGQIFRSLAGKTVLLVGAGQTAELAAQALVRAGTTRLIVANRTLAKARQLADSFLTWQKQETFRAADKLIIDGQEVKCPALRQLLATCPLHLHSEPHDSPALTAEAVGLEELPVVLPKVDLAICSTGAPEPVLTYAALHDALARLDHSLLLVDLAVPRDIDERLADLGNVFLYNIDALEGIIKVNLDRRRQEIPLAEAIVADEVRGFYEWMATLVVVPTIKLLQQRLADLQKEQVERYHRRFANADRQQLEEFSRSLCQKILHDPIDFLRQLDSTDGDGSSDLASVSVLRRIFKLDPAETEDEP